MANKIEKFTQRARRILSLAQEEAERMEHSYIGSEHLLVGMIREEGGVAGRVLRDLGLETQKVGDLTEALTKATKRSADMPLDLSHGTKKVLEYAVDEARRMKHEYIGTEHLLLGITRETDGIALKIIQQLGISPEEIRRQVRRVLQDSPMPPKGTSTASRPEATLEIPLHFTITTEGKPPAEFTLSFKQLQEVIMGEVFLKLSMTTAKTLFEQTIGDTQITITRADTGDNPLPDEGNSTT